MRNLWHNSVELETKKSVENSKKSGIEEGWEELKNKESAENFLKNNIEETARKFSKDSRMTGGGESRSQKPYGLLEELGILINFTRNNFFKGNSKLAKASDNSTRDYFVSEIDIASLKEGSKEDRGIINALIGYIKGINRFRVKYIKYGNHNAIHEVISQKLYSLVGLESPRTVFMAGEGLFSANNERVGQDFNEKNKIPNLSVASPMIVGYRDLGDFLTRERTLDLFIENEKHREFCKVKQQEIKDINQTKPITAENKLLRIKLMSEIYELMPSYIHNEIEKSFAASKFIGNWDFANFSLSNIGCRFTLDKEDKVVKFESVFVDFGNSGVIGFGGKYKELSHDRANTEAKSKDKSPEDYDPELALNEEEQEIELIRNELKNNQKSLSKKLSQHFWNSYALLKDHLEFSQKWKREKIKSTTGSLIFKTAHHIRKEEAGIRITPETTGLLTFSDLPRNLPFGILLEKALKEKTESYDSAPSYRDSEIEIAFRLSLITDEAINYVIKKWNLSDRYPNIFPLPEGLKFPQEYCGENLAKIFIDRRDALVDSIPREVVNKWVLNNKAKALGAQENVKNAILEETDLKHGINQENSLYSRINSLPKNTADDAISSLQKKELSDVPTLAFKIERKIRDFNSDETSCLKIEEIKKEITQKETSIKELENDLAISEKPALQVALREAINALNDSIESKKEVMVQKNMEEKIEMIRSNYQEWKVELGCVNPSEEFFDFETTERIFKIKKVKNFLILRQLKEFLKSKIGMRHLKKYSTKTNLKKFILQKRTISVIDFSTKKTVSFMTNL